MTRSVAMLALVLIGCGSDGRGDENPSHDLGEVVAHLAELRAATEAHGKAVRSAADLAAIAEEEDRHAAQAGEHMEQMSAEMDDMMGCEDAQGAPPDMDEMTKMHAMREGEMSAHAKAMAGAADRAAALAEEERHQDEMGEHIGHMEHMMGMMGDIGGMFTCRTDAHEHAQP